MHEFRYQRDTLVAEKVSLQALAKEYGTPLYVYSESSLAVGLSQLDVALSPVDHLICYAMKANSNQAVLRVMANQGAGFDTVSAGEIQRAIAAGGDPRKCVFAGVGKTNEEIAYALRQRIYCFNVESEPELKRINRIAGQLKKTAPVALRINPDVDAKTHAKITTGTYANKFGIPFEEAEALYDRASRLKHLNVRGVQMHIGSQLTTVAPFERAVRKAVPLAERLRDRYGIEFVSIGGGIGIVYDMALESGPGEWWSGSAGKRVITPAKYARAVLPHLKPLNLRVLVEPGRYIAGNAGVLVTRVEYVKKTGKKNFVIVDAAMNDLIRPAMYDAFHEIVPVRRRKRPRVLSDVVGPICESGDTFCKDRPMEAVDEGDYLCLMSAGAYGFVMASTYNTRPLAAEVMVSGRKHAQVRKRQPVRSIWAGESTPEWL